MLCCSRVAMLAVAGILLVEAVGRGPWWTAPFRVCASPTISPHPFLQPLLWYRMATIMQKHAVEGDICFLRASTVAHKPLFQILM